MEFIGQYTGTALNNTMVSSGVALVSPMRFEQQSQSFSLLRMTRPDQPHSIANPNWPVQLSTLSTPKPMSALFGHFWTAEFEEVPLSALQVVLEGGCKGSGFTSCY
jgi:hypothetical protein